MPYLRDRVIVLKKEPYREHDRRYVMYGREHGLLSAVARGASSPRSKQASHLEPFSEAEVMIAKGIAFDKLAVASGVPMTVGSLNLSALTILGAFMDLVIRLSRPGISDERIFDLLKETVETMRALPIDPSADRAQLVHAAVTLRLLDLIGFAPDVASDANVTLLKFMRHAPLADVLRVTAPRDVLRDAASFVGESLVHAPLDQEPHGPRTILTYLK